MPGIKSIFRMTEDIKNSLETLRKGGTILYPTDTIWGIGCDATNFEAVKKIYELKKRNDSKQMLVLLDDVSRLNEYITQVPDIAFDLIKIAEKPLTIIYPGAKNLPPGLYAEDGSIGIRITNDQFCKNLVAQFKKPIVSSSANLSNQPYPSDFSEISPEILKAVDYIVKWRQNDFSKSKPSAIIKIGINGEVQVIRQ